MCGNPNVTPLERVIIATADLTSVLQTTHHNLPQIEARDHTDTLTAINKLAEIFCKKYNKNKNSLTMKSIQPLRVYIKQYTPQEPTTPTRVRRPITSTPKKTTWATTSNTPRPHSYKIRHRIKLYGACAVVDPVLGKVAEYKLLIKHPKYKKNWSRSMSNEIRRFAQGNNKSKALTQCTSLLTMKSHSTDEKTSHTPE